MHPIVRRAAVVWLPIAVGATGIAGGAFAAVQQDLRLGANDPQIQMVEDATTRLSNGATPASIVPEETVDLGSSLRSFVMVYDRSGRLVGSSATLDGGPPPFPVSVFTSVRDGRQERITWQPRTGVRSAVVVQAWRGGFVVAGRSLRLVEERVATIQLLTGGVWLLTLAATAVAALLGAATYELPALVGK